MSHSHRKIRPWGGLLVTLFLGFGVFGLSAANAQAPTPELRAYDILGDSIIRFDQDNWNYLAAVRYDSGGLEIVHVNGVDFYRHASPRSVFPAPESPEPKPGLSFVWSGAVDNLGEGAGARPPYVASSAINGIFAGSLYNGFPNRELTISGLEVGGYYTIQIFNASTHWNWGAREGTFSFSSDGGVSQDSFQVFDSNLSPSLTQSIRLNQQYIVDTFPNLLPTNPPTAPENPHIPGPANLTSIEYTFQATATEMKMDLQSHDSNNTWHFYALAVAQHESDPFAIIPTGSLVNDNGRLRFSAYNARNGFADDIEWRIMAGYNADGSDATITIGTGTTAAGNSKTLAYLKTDLTDFWEVRDPDFQLSGEAFQAWHNGEGSEAEAFQYWKRVGNLNSSTSPDGPFRTQANSINSTHFGDYKAVPSECYFGDGDRENGNYGLGILESEAFTLRAGDEISFYLQGGRSSVKDISGGDSTAGFLGVALWDTIGEKYLISQAIPGSGDGINDNNIGWAGFTLTAEDLMAFADMEVTLRIIDDVTGGWGWVAADDFSLWGASHVADDLYYFLSYKDGDNWVLLDTLGPADSGGVPEPTTWVLMVLGLLGGCWVKIRK